MGRGVALLVVGVLAVGLGLASARGASGAATTTTTTTATTATTTATTTQSYEPLAPSLLPAGCVGAGTVAVVPPSHPVVALGTPASTLGPSGYPVSASTVAFGSAAVSGSTCGDTTVTLASVSLFGGAVTASSVEATDGQGTVAGLEVDGAVVSATAGQTVPVGSWGQLTLGETFGRLTAPLVLRLVQAQDSLPAGTTIALAFAATPRPVPRPGVVAASTPDGHDANFFGSQRQAKGASTKKHRRPRKPPDFPASTYPFLMSGGLAGDARGNPVVSIAMRYLGVRYQWGGARPATGFDCSGLVKFVFAHLGVSLPHYAAAQWDSPDTVWIPPDKLQPGDLVFFTGSDGTREEPGHVGIYVDDGYIIDAPHTGSFVRIDRLSQPRLANGYVGARRVVGQPLVARHLLGVGNAAAAVDAIDDLFPPQIGLRPMGEMPAAAAGTAALRQAPRGYTVWVATLGGLFLLLGAGLFVFRRHRAPSSDPST